MIESPDAHDQHTAPTEHERRRLRLLPLVGACLACCVPMLLVLGVVSVGAALAGAVGLATPICLVAAATLLVPRVRRRG